MESETSGKVREGQMNPFMDDEEEKERHDPDDKSTNQIKISRETIEIQVNMIMNTLLVLVPSGKVMKNFNKVVLEPLLDIIDLFN